MNKVILVFITLSLLLGACGNNPNKTAWSLGTGAVLGGATFASTKNPQATIVATGVGLALGQHIGSKFDEVAQLRAEVLSLNKDGEVFLQNAGKLCKAKVSLNYEYCKFDTIKFIDSVVVLECE